MVTPVDVFLYGPHRSNRPIPPPPPTPVQCKNAQFSVFMANSNLTDNDMQCSMLMTVLDGQYLRENDEILSFADVDLFFMAAINSA